MWHKFLTSPDSEYWVQLTPGSAVGTLGPVSSTPPVDNTLFSVINNHRVLHGRSAFDGKRRMCGAYIGMDEYRSKLSVLSEKFATNSITNSTEAGADADSKERSSWNPAF